MFCGAWPKAKIGHNKKISAKRTEKKEQRILLFPLGFVYACGCLSASAHIFFRYILFGDFFSHSKFETHQITMTTKWDVTFPWCASRYIMCHQYRIEFRVKQKTVWCRDGAPIVTLIHALFIFICFSDRRSSHVVKFLSISGQMHVCVGLIWFGGFGGGDWWCHLVMFGLETIVKWIYVEMDRSESAPPNWAYATSIFNVKHIEPEKIPNHRTTRHILSPISCWI